MAVLYVLRFGNEPIFKVGFTTRSVERRVRELSTGSARQLKTVAEFPVVQEVIRQCEAHVHAELDHLKHREGGQEFFRFEDQEKFCALVHDSIKTFVEMIEHTDSISQAPLGDFEGSRLPVSSLPVETSEVIVNALRDRSALVAQMRLLELRRKALEDALRGRFGAVDSLLAKDGSELLRWEKTQQKHFDLNRFRAEQPALAEHYTETRTLRSLRFA